MAEKSLLYQLALTANTLPKAQRKVVEVLLQHSSVRSTWRIKDLSEMAGVSMPTPLRLARSMGYSGIREFLLDLARDQARGHDIHRHVNIKDPPQDIIDKILNGAVASIKSLQHQLQADVLMRVAEKMANAERIDCYSVGSTSSFMAQDLQARLFRIGKVAHAIHDAHLQLISAASQSQKGVVFAISHIGRMPSLLEAVSLARAQGCFVVGLTQPNTRLALVCDCSLNIQVPSDAITRVGTEAYIAHLLVIEVLMVMTLRFSKPEALAHLRQFRKVLQAHGQDTENQEVLRWALSQSEMAHT